MKPVKPAAMTTRPTTPLTTLQMMAPARLVEADSGIGAVPEVVEDAEAPAAGAAVLDDGATTIGGGADIKEVNVRGLMQLLLAEDASAKLFLITLCLSPHIADQWLLSKLAMVHRLENAVQ